MKAAGIVAEYNPLHNGHVFHIERTKELTGADAVIVAMSGDYVQRGEPALMDKWVRAEHAVRSGADLVIEMPVLFALGNARQFAQAGVSMLEATGKVSHISFGSESGETEALSDIAETLGKYHDEIEELILKHRRDGLSYPAARILSYAEIKGDIKGCDPAEDPDILSEIRMLNSPNDLLAIEYIKAMHCAQPLAIHREGSGYSDPYDEKFRYQSASALRTQIFSGHDVSGYVPDFTSDAFRNCHLTGPDQDKWFDILRYAVLSADTATIEDCPSGGEGLANLLKSKAVSAGTWSAYIRRVKSKRYTYTRLSRLCMQILLGITRMKYDMDQPEYIRVLGFSEAGKKLLAEIRDEECASLPVVINVNKSMPGLSDRAVKQLELDMHAADIYNLVTGRDLKICSDHRHSPVILTLF